MPFQLTFHGAAGTVTGSKYLLETDAATLLVDCGMFQGERPLRERNWQPFPFDPQRLDAVLLTHAHLDHSGMLPVLYRAGYRGPVYCTRSTAALAEILLTDAGRIQEEDAHHANRHDYSRHHPAKPLFTQADAVDALQLLRPVEFDTAFQPARSPDVHATFRRAGHILGASWIALDVGNRRVAFSGDLGRPVDPIMRPPSPLDRADVLVLESTYGDRTHDPRAPEAQLLDAVERTRARGGVVLIPAFAVGRTQAVLYLLWRLRSAGRLHPLPIFLDSPMAIDATELLRASPDDHRLTEFESRAIGRIATYVRTSEESRALNDRHEPMIIVSASGMMSGGRILHHLRHRASDPRNTILFTGYQAHGTLGEHVQSGARSATIHGRTYAIHAEVAAITSLSAHADRDELVGWVGDSPVERIFLTHGEADASRALRAALIQRGRAVVECPGLNDTVEL